MRPAISLHIDTVLPDSSNGNNLCPASAKSEARYWRIGNIVAQQSPSVRLFCCKLSCTTPFMVVVMGREKSRAASTCAVTPTLSQLPPIQTLACLIGGSITRGAGTMSLYRLAILSGDTSRLCACTVTQYQTITAPSYAAAMAVARSQYNAIVVGWRAAR